MKVKIGTKVEVCSEEEGYGGAWFEGTVIGFGNGGRKRTFFIQYDKFITQDLNGEALVEEICLKNMRPIPPYKRMPKNLSAGVAVEAVDSDCWWKGFLSTRFRSPFTGEELFQVYFPDTRTIKAYPRCDLRLAQEWIRGKWRPLLCS